MSLPEDLLRLLACPACRGPLRSVAGCAGLACAACGVVYPVEDGIPVLLTEASVPLVDWERKHGAQASA